MKWMLVATLLLMGCAQQKVVYIHNSQRNFIDLECPMGSQDCIEASAEFCGHNGAISYTVAWYGDKRMIVRCENVSQGH